MVVGVTVGDCLGGRVDLELIVACLDFIRVGSLSLWGHLKRHAWWALAVRGNHLGRALLRIVVNVIHLLKF